MRVAFILWEFPVITETFIISQITDLLDRGIDVRLFAFRKGDTAHVSERFTSYNLESRVAYIRPPPKWKLARALTGIPLFCRLLAFRPRVAFRALNPFKRGRGAPSLRLLYQAAPFAGRHFDLVHCHTGIAANCFLPIYRVLGLAQPLLTTFYGYDVSAYTKLNPAIYDELQQIGRMFFVMSEDMRQRVLALGFPTEKVRVLPVSIDVDSYAFRETRYCPSAPVELVSVARFVEKKGLDDLVRALALVRKATTARFHCTIIGSGPLEGSIKKLIADLDLTDVMTLKGYMKIEDIISTLASKHIFIQPSKTASNGDME
jgi:colanic acid/amylovoran biosynthesis glycosyltransferase